MQEVEKEILLKSLELIRSHEDLNYDNEVVQDLITKVKNSFGAITLGMVKKKIELFDFEMKPHLYNHYAIIDKVENIPIFIFDPKSEYMESNDSLWTDSNLRKSIEVRGKQYIENLVEVENILIKFLMTSLEKRGI